MILNPFIEDRFDALAVRFRTQGGSIARVGVLAAEVASGRAGLTQPNIDSLSASLDDVPVTAGVDQRRADHLDVYAVHQPNRRRPIVVLPDDIGLVVAIGVVGLFRMP